ncbi:MAG: PQQ-binding-like beta-propeller repeat protein [Bradymonadia bacterium]
MSTAPDVTEVCTLEHWAWNHTYAPLAWYDGTLYTASEYGAAAAIDDTTGQVLWRVGLPGRGNGFCSTPLCVEDDRLIVARRDRTVVFDRHTGDILWTVKGEQPGMAVIMGDEVVFGDYHGLYSYSPSARTRRGSTLRASNWSIDPPGVSKLTLLQWRDHLILQSGDFLLCIDPQTQTQLWSSPVLDDYTYPVCLDGDRIYGGQPGKLGPGHNVCVAWDAHTGEIVWKQHMLRGGPLGKPAAGLGMVFVRDEAGGLSALDAETGQCLWHHQAPSPWARPWAGPILRGETVLFTTQDGALRGYAAQDGTLLWSLDAEDEKGQSRFGRFEGVVQSSDAIFTGSGRGRLMRIEVPA